MSADPPPDPSVRPVAGQLPAVAWPPAVGTPSPVEERPRPRRRWRWLLVAAVTAWSVLLVGLAVGSVRHDTPTVREQHDIAEARPVVDRAAIDLTAAVGDAGVLVVGAEEIRESCRITPVRPGAELTRLLTAYTAADSGPELVDRVARQLPASYAARARHGGAAGGSRFGADAGDFVVVRGELTAPGVVEFRITTGCRPTSGQFQSAAADPRPGTTPGVRARSAAEVLAFTFQTAEVRAESSVELACPNGELLRSQVVTAATTAESDEWAAEAFTLPHSTVVSERSPLFVHRYGTQGSVVRVDGDSLWIASTVFGC
ncbi:hypothetical protein [Micromonospora sp. LOL_023]|uniref:hypothetical protein n=1 Tax=Micromonospora sp. LOL_023 TaxID=3345418 RepID=UPI003A882CAE